MRTVRTTSGATAVQIVRSSRRGSRPIEHLGSAHDEAELEALKAAAEQRIAAGQLAPASYRTLKRRLPAYAEEGWRQQLSEAAVGTSSPVSMLMTVTVGPVPDGWLPG
jgi:hypothetical protein